MRKSPRPNNHREIFSRTLHFALKFRLAVTFVLGMIAGGIVVDQCSGDEAAGPPPQPVITDAGGASAEALPPPPEPPEPDDEVDFSQCRNLVFKIVHPKCKKLSDEEIRKQYLARVKRQRDERAAEIIKMLDINDPEDRAKIRRAVYDGCTEIKDFEGTWLQLEAPPVTSQCGGPIELNERPEKDWIDLDEEEYEQLSDEDKLLTDLYRDRNYEEVLKRTHFDDLKRQIDELMEYDEEFNELKIGESFYEDIKMLEEIRDQILRTDNEKERQRIMCELIIALETQSGHDKRQIDKIMRLMEQDDIDLTSFDDTVRFQVFWQSLITLSGFGSEEEMVRSDICDPIFREAFKDE